MLWISAASNTNPFGQVSERLNSQEAPYAKASKAERATIARIAVSLVSLITALSEAGDEILEITSANATITRFLVTLITYKSQLNESDPIADLRSDALACLMLLTEDNVKLAQELAAAEDDKFYNTITTLKDEANGEGVLACAVLHNIYSSLRSPRKAKNTSNADDAPLIPTLVKVISTFDAGQDSVLGGGWTNLADYQQLALETIASIGTSLTLDGSSGPKLDQKEAPKAEDEGDEDMEDADGSDPEDQDGAEEEDDDEMDQEAMEADMDMVTGVDSEDESTEDFPVIQSLLQTALPQLVRIASLQPGNDTALSIQNDALSAINNVAWSLSLFDFSQAANAGIRKAWGPIAKTIWETIISPTLATDTADIQLATQVTSIGWAVARVLGSETPLKPEEQRKFITLFGAVRGNPESSTDNEDPFQALSVKCIGVLGQLAQGDCPEDRNREIGVFLVTVLAGLPQTSPAEAVEAFNQVFDVYGDEERGYDRTVFWANNFLNQLEEVLPKARAMAKSVNKKDQPELRLRADESVMNLTRFIAYKKKHKPSK